MSRDDKLGPILKIALNIYQCDVLYKKMSATQNLKRFVYILEGVLNFIVFPVDLEKPLCGNTELLRLTMTEVTSKWAQE